MIGTIAACITAILLTCVFGFILKMMSGIPYGMIDYVVIGIEGISVLLGAYIACVIVKSRGLIIGAVIGSVSLLILLCCGFILPENNIGLLTVIRCAVLLVCGIIGGIVGVNKKERVKIK
ncbi:MAG: TIGR04086 family membrane protein [Ruminococcus sp.]|nr:TIGR04086 family membrane protein [Ruminococcus sp.]